MAGPLSRPGPAWSLTPSGEDGVGGWERATGRFQRGGQTSPRLRAALRVGRPDWGQGGEEGTLIATHPQQERGGALRGRRDTDNVGLGGGVRRNAPLCARSLSLFWRAQPTALRRPPPAQCIPGEAGVLWGGVRGLSQACAAPLQAGEVEDPFSKDWSLCQERLRRLYPSNSCSSSWPTQAQIPIMMQCTGSLRRVARLA